MKELAGSGVVVIGLGLSGVSAAELCLARGARVRGVDKRSLDQLDPAVRALGIEVLDQDRVGPEPYAEADLVVISPGVAELPALRRAEALGTEIVGELELASRFCRAPIVAIGGTNGKSTTTELVAAMLAADGRRVFCGGNLGTPLCRAVSGDFDVLVVEVSSFQLERAPTFRPRVSVLLNVTEDHLDRHGSFAAYAAAKGNAFVNQGPDDVAVALFGDAEVARQVARGKARVLHFGEGGDYVVSGQAVLEVSAGERHVLPEPAFSSLHARLDAAAAVAAARAMGASTAAVSRALGAHQPLPHRLTRVRSLAGVTYYDDSKATNVGAAVAAIEGLAESRVVLIAGGKGKDGSYRPLAEALARRGRASVLIGEAAPLMADALAGSVPVERARDMRGAVSRARALAEPGDAVLLSPACASFDMFRSYAHRGQCFVDAVRDLTEPLPPEGEAGG